jgi:prepilin-type N-terminal cleavage/methylation domain-containing protein
MKLPIPHALRRGYTLIELLVVIALGAAVMGLAVMILLSVGRYERRLDDESAQRAEWTRLTERMRSDMHTAVGYQFDEAAGAVELEQSDGSQVTYTLRDGRCERRVQDSARQHDELTTAFCLSPGGQLCVEPAEGGAGDRAEIALGRALLPIVTVVGSDHQLLHP